MLWLDYALYVILWRLIRRTLWCWMAHTEFSPGNVVATVLRDHRPARHTCAQQAGSGRYAGIPVVRLRRPAKIDRLLHSLTN